MRCNVHRFDFTGTGGICASCLRERLLAIIAAQEEENRKSFGDAPPSCSFPVPVYRRDARSGLTEEKGKKSKVFFSSRIMSLFKSKSGELSDRLTDLEDRCSDNHPWWFHGRKEKTTSLCAVESRMNKRNCPCPRGLSPVRDSDEEAEACLFGSSDCTSESSKESKQTPPPPQQPKTTAKPFNRLNLSRFRFCLSPIVRPSPNGLPNGRGIFPEIAAAGASRLPARRSVFKETPFGKNRSRKLANRGRYSSSTSICDL
ncbi:hypothetical protein M569_05948 [Genlisea aurea]|uniref:Uncharacterized protein n=1 Tax=Genlisea aurea TaxID=192259 RepID=S8CV94_9LAMI|nr:hypothetical protein M569_05948 [Genlisea aurea]